jgi:hypothetical protein
MKNKCLNFENELPCHFFLKIIVDEGMMLHREPQRKIIENHRENSTEQ